MESVSFRPETQPSIYLPQAEEVPIIIVSDIQYGTIGCDVTRLRRLVEWGAEHNAYWLNLGDNIDVASPSGREKLEAAHLYDSVYTALDAQVQEMVDELSAVLAPTKGRWIGWIEGHHFHIFPGGKTTDMLLMEKLGGVFLGTCARVYLSIGEGTYIIYAHHGVGSGVSIGSALRALATRAVPYWEADAYLMGHLHRLECTILPWIDAQGRERGRLLLCTGSYLRGYVEGSTVRGRPGGTYVERKMLPPNYLGSPVLWLRPRPDGLIEGTVSLTF